MARWSPRIDLVFRFGQCDKENHGWREGLPLTVSAKFRSRGPAFTLRQSQFRTKKEYCLCRSAANSPAHDFGRYKAAIRPE
jgi:hypothetical protein